MNPNGPMPESRWRMLYPCRTCGQMPRVSVGHTTRKAKVENHDDRREERDLWTIECPNMLCPEQPVAVEETEDEASRVWNAHQRQERKVATDEAPDRFTEYARQFHDWRVSQGRLV